MRRVIVSLLFVSVFVFFSAAGQSYGASGYPAKPIEIVCPYTPGSGMDLLARVIANIAPKYLGQPMVVTTKPGAGGSIAAADVIQSKADGYKLMITTYLFFSMTTKTQKVPFSSEDLVPLANFMEYRNVFIVKGDSPFKTFNDVLDYARKNPGKLKWSHTGRGNSQHTYGLLMFRKAHVETVDIPYKGSPEMLSALLGGHTQLSFMVYGAVHEQVRAGTVRYIVTVGEQRYTNLPQVPCAGELGFPEVSKLPTYVGLYIHKDTSEEIKKILFDAMKKTYDSPEFKKGFEALGEEPRFGGADFLRKSIVESERISVPILKEFGLYIEGK